MKTRTGWKKLLLAASAAVCSYTAAWAETRLALVIGNAGYADAPLKTAVNDAALVGETLRQLGFDVSEGRDLDQTTLRRLVRDFAAKIDATDGEITVYIYLAGHGAQAGALNYFMPTDARIMRPGDVAAEALSIDALIRETQNQKVKTRFVVLDAATQFPGAAAAKLSPGLAALTPAADSLIASSASPTEIMPPQAGDYGAYALALTQTMREPGLQPDDIFNRVKLRVHQETKGVAMPVHVSALARPFVFLERAPDAPPVQPQAAADPRRMAYRDLDPATAYALAIERDTLKDYRDFLAAFPNDPLAKKIRARMVQKREARAWQLAARKHTREALWTYRKHYPRGAHFEEAGYELAELGAPPAPPADFVVERWDEFEPPPPDEVAYYEEIITEPMTYRAIVPPPPPAWFVPPSPVYEYVPPPPPPSSGPGMLPLIGLGALGAAAILPMIVKRPPPRAQQPVAVQPPRPPVAPVLVNPPPVPGATRPSFPNQIMPQPPGGTAAPVSPGGRPPLPGQIPPAANRGPIVPGSPPVSAPGVTPPPAGTQLPGGVSAPTRPPAATVPPVSSAPSVAPTPPTPGQQTRPTGRPGRPSVQGQPLPGTPAPVSPPVVRPPTAPGAIVREVAPRPVPPPMVRQPIPPRPAPVAVPRTAPPPVAVPRPAPAPFVRQPPPRPMPPPMAAPRVGPPPMSRPPAPPPMAAPRPAPPPVARPSAPPPRPAGRPGCAPNDPRPQCR